MNRITEITKRDILDLFQNGLEIDEFFQTRTVTYNYYGRLEEIDFLKRLYDLERMPSFDSRFANAEQDIWQHTVNNDDYPYCWVFEDKRFNLQDGSDEVYLKFLCEVFHPAVRYDKGYWKEFWLNHKFCGISDSSRSSVGSYRIASERNIRHQDIRIPVCEES